MLSRCILVCHLTERLTYLVNLQFSVFFSLMCDRFLDRYKVKDLVKGRSYEVKVSYPATVRSFMLMSEMKVV